MIRDDLHWIRFGYLRRVLAERWPLPSRVPTMLDVSRDSSVVAARFVRLGFHVEGIRLQDASVESLRQRLGDRTAAFDVVCCWDVLDQGDNWQAIVGVMARVLRSGGVFCYSISGRATGGWGLLNRVTRRWLKQPDELIAPRDLRPTLLRKGLFPQRGLWLGQGVNSPTMSWAERDCVVSYMGYAFRARDLPASLTEGSWRFRTTLEQWVYVPTEQGMWGTYGPRRKAG